MRIEGKDGLTFGASAAGLLLLLACFGGVATGFAGDGRVALAHAEEVARAWQCHTNGSHANSIAHYQAALQAAPESLEARLGYLLPLLALERFPEAEVLAAGILRQYPANYYANLRLAYALRRQGKYEAAESVLSQALGCYPTDVALLLELALVKRARHQNATARRIWFDVLTLSPDNPLALQQLADPALAQNPVDEPLSSVLQAEGGRKIHFETAAYYAFHAYRDTVAKDHAHAVGLYAALNYGMEHVLELEQDHLHKYYRGFPSLRQYDTTLAYANYSLPHLKLRLGGHHVAGEDPFTDGGWTAFGGAEWYDINRWAAGVDGAFSSYPEFQAGLNVLQVSPHLGLTLWQGKNHLWSHELRGYWIHPNQNSDSQRDLFSVENRLSLGWRDWNFSAVGWAGEQMYAVRNDGFAVYNLGEKHKAGYGLEIRYAISRHLSCAVRASREHFRDLVITPNASSESYMAMLSLKY